MAATEGGVLRPGAEAIKFMLMHDHQQVFAWHDESNRSGLEVCLIIIDKLLGPSVEDNAASEGIFNVPNFLGRSSILM
jgi:hypothetical protein